MKATDMSYTVTVRQHGGELDGIREAWISNSQAVALSFRRLQLDVVRKKHKQLDRVGNIEKQAGVYIQIGEQPANLNKKRSFYIGKSGQLGRRLYEHSLDGTSGGLKEDWLDTVVLIRQCDPLSIGHALHVESCLISDSCVNFRWDSENKHRPTPEEAGKLQSHERKDASIFVKQAKTLIGTLGWYLFEDGRGNASQHQFDQTNAPTMYDFEKPKFFMKAQAYNATMRLDLAGRFVVLKGSRIREKETEKTKENRKWIVERRKKLIQDGILVRKGEWLFFSADYSFPYVSRAAEVVKGASANGRTEWKLEDGETTYNEWEKSLCE